MVRARTGCSLAKEHRGHCERGGGAAAVGACCHALAAAPRLRGMLLPCLLLAAAAGGTGGAAGPSPDELAAGLSLADVASARHWVRTGEALEAQDLADLALEAFLVASRLDPVPPTPHERMGSILETRFGDADGAVPHYRRATRRGSTDAHMHYRMGNFASARGQHELAARLHSAAVALHPAHFEAHNNLGTALISLANAASEPRAQRDFFRRCLCMRALHICARAHPPTHPRADPQTYSQASVRALHTQTPTHPHPPTHPHTHTHTHTHSALDALAAAIALQPSHDVPLRTAMTLAHKTCDFRYWVRHAGVVRDSFEAHLRKGAQVVCV